MGWGAIAAGGGPYLVAFFGFLLCTYTERSMRYVAHQQLTFLGTLSTLFLLRALGHQLQPSSHCGPHRL